MTGPAVWLWSARPSHFHNDIMTLGSHPLSSPPYLPRYFTENWNLPGTPVYGRVDPGLTARKNKPCLGWGVEPGPLSLQTNARTTLCHHILSHCITNSHAHTTFPMSARVTPSLLMVFIALPTQFISQAVISPSFSEPRPMDSLHWSCKLIPLFFLNCVFRFFAFYLFRQVSLSLHTNISIRVPVSFHRSYKGMTEQCTNSVALDRILTGTQNWHML